MSWHDPARAGAPGDAVSEYVVLGRIERGNHPNARKHVPRPVQPPEWTSQGACLSDPEPFEAVFEGRGNPSASVYACRLICGTCMVRSACLDMALENESGGVTYRFGVFGGFTPAERAALADET